MKRKKNEEYEESEITTIYILGFKLYFARKHNLKKSCLNHQILFTLFMRCKIFETQLMMQQTGIYINIEIITL